MPHSQANECHFDNPRYNQLYKEALATIDIAKQTEIVHEMQMIDWTEGGYIIPFFSPTIDGYSPRLVGPRPTKTGLPLTNYGLKNFYFTS